MDKDNATPTWRKYGGALLLIILLVGFPLGSYLYLKKGYDYQKAALDDMRRTDRLTDASSLELVSGELPEVQQGVSRIIGLLGTAPESMTDTYAATLRQLYEQFDELDNLQFWTVFGAVDSSRVAEFVKRSGLKEDETQLLYFRSPEYSNFVSQLKLSAEEAGYLRNHPLLVLVDDSLYVRRAFRADIPEEVRQLVERTAIVVPERSRPKPRIVRETEK